MMPNTQDMSCCCCCAWKTRSIKCSADGWWLLQHVFLHPVQDLSVTASLLQKKEKLTLHMTEQIMLCTIWTTGGDPPVVQEPLGWEQLGRTYSHRISGFTRHGGRQRREILGIRSSVRQRSARSSPPRRRRSIEALTFSLRVTVLKLT